jgi:leader peptidase (prepilin peptidase)/N-methyltransferase
MSNWLAAIFFGWLLGMLINYLADVLPSKRRLVRPFCLQCDEEMEIRRYLLWPRRCMYCGRLRPLRTWIVEMGMILMGFILSVAAPVEIGTWLGLILLAYLCLVTVIDLERRIIMHVTSWFGTVLTFLIGYKLHGLQATILGGAAGFGIMLLFYALGLGFIRISQKISGRTLSEQEAIGFGDVNLGGIVGLLLGWPGITLGLIIAILLGGLASLGLIAWNLIRRSYRPNLALPYGPFLTASAFILIYLRNTFYP